MLNYLCMLHKFIPQMVPLSEDNILIKVPLLALLILEDEHP